MERRGILRAATLCHELDLIWRDILQEDVGVDGTLEISLNEFPTGKLLGVQVKSGNSYVRGETETGFRFYPDKDDLAYWRSLTLPLILMVFDPRYDEVYWIDIHSYMENRPENPLGSSYLDFRKSNRLNTAFREHLLGKFDLRIATDEQFRSIKVDLEKLEFTDDCLESQKVKITGLDLFIQGLWGLCTKVNFHLSLLTDLIRLQLAKRPEPSMITYDLSREKLYPLLNGYFLALGSSNLAAIDFDDLNHTLYGKMEWPTFIAPLTLNGRAFVEFLRKELAGTTQVCDHQFFSLGRWPLMQIEIYDAFDSNLPQPFGRCVSVISIKFNKYLDYYTILHLKRSKEGGFQAEVNQSIYYYELREYLESIFQDTPKDHIVARHQDSIVTPLACWLESYLGVEHGIASAEIGIKPLSDHLAFQEELATILTPGCSSFLKTEPVFVDERSLTLMNGEFILVPNATDKSLQGSVDLH